MSFFLNINCSKVLSFILQRSGLKIFPAMLNKHSTGAKDAGMLNTHFAIIAKLGLLLSYPIFLRVNVLFNFFLFLEVFFNFVILIEILCRPFLFINESENLFFSCGSSVFSCDSSLQEYVLFIS